MFHVASVIRYCGCVLKRLDIEVLFVHPLSGHETSSVVHRVHEAGTTHRSDFPFNCSLESLQSGLPFTGICFSAPSSSPYLRKLLNAFKMVSIRFCFGKMFIISFYSSSPKSPRLLTSFMGNKTYLSVSCLQKVLFVLMRLSRLPREVQWSHHVSAHSRSGYTISSSGIPRLQEVISSNFTGGRVSLSHWSHRKSSTRSSASCPALHHLRQWSQCAAAHNSRPLLNAHTSLIYPFSCLPSLFLPLYSLPLLTLHYSACPPDPAPTCLPRHRWLLFSPRDARQSYWSIGCQYIAEFLFPVKMFVSIFSRGDMWGGNIHLYALQAKKHRGVQNVKHERLWYCVTQDGQYFASYTLSDLYADEICLFISIVWASFRLKSFSASQRTTSLKSKISCV